MENQADIVATLRLRAKRLRMRRKPAFTCKALFGGTAHLIRIVEGEGDVGPAFTSQGAVRAGLPLHHPTNPQECRQHASARTRPVWCKLFDGPLA